jgi:hypothetical protein
MVAGSWPAQKVQKILSGRYLCGLDGVRLPAVSWFLRSCDGEMRRGLYPSGSGDSSEKAGEHIDRRYERTDLSAYMYT